ncbi:MAG: LamG domain-containing protein, partial [Alphaproteobacteria bacterium]|nr:LamG domain-containing protein [Alphaproteobacteria bacterium]
MTAVMGYADCRSVRAGGRIEFKVSCHGAARYRARIVRLMSPQAYPPPLSPPFRALAMNSAVDGDYAGREQRIPIGSYGIVPTDPVFAALGSFTLAATVWPTLPKGGEQVVLGTWSPATGAGVALILDVEGRPALVIGGGAGRPRAVVTLPQALAAQRWVFLAASVEAAARSATLVAIPLERHQFDRGEPQAITVPLPALPTHAVVPFMVAAALDGEEHGVLHTSAHFNGKIERPAVFGAALDGVALARLAAAGPSRATHPEALAEWDLSRDTSGDGMFDLTRAQRHGRLVNLPTRAVVGSAWTGARHDWRAVPGEYTAVHFHDDDLADARWRTDFTLDVPRDWASGCYAAHLTAGESEFWVPFFVRPAPGEEGRRARAAFLAPTCTYAAYSNFRSRVTGRWNELYHGRLTVLDATDWLMQDFPGLVSSTYDAHRDGSAVVYSSMLRPVTNFRPTGRIYKFCQDLLIVDWLDRAGFDCEIVTDDDLHAEGAAALAPYACILSASHPEYYTTAMLDGLEQYLLGGGRFMYLGGNGFYWRTAFHPTLPGVVEVRRKGLGFLGPTAVPEGHFSLTGEVAGTWASVGRPPNLICGVGFVTQGFDRCEGYRRKSASRDPRAAFIFEGVGEDEIIGEFGMLQGGAAGYEIDRADAA